MLSSSGPVTRIVISHKPCSYAQPVQSRQGRSDQIAFYGESVLDISDVRTGKCLLQWHPEPSDASGSMFYPVMDGICGGFVVCTRSQTIGPFHFSQVVVVSRTSGGVLCALPCIRCRDDDAGFVLEYREHTRDSDGAFVRTALIVSRDHTELPDNTLVVGMLDSALPMSVKVIVATSPTTGVETVEKVEQRFEHEVPLDSERHPLVGTSGRRLISQDAYERAVKQLLPSYAPVRYCPEKSSPDGKLLALVRCEYPDADLVVLDWSAVNNEAATEQEDYVVFSLPVRFEMFSYTTLLFDRTSTLLVYASGNSLFVLSLPLRRKVLERIYDDLAFVQIAIIDDDDENVTPSRGTTLLVTGLVQCEGDENTSRETLCETYLL